MKETTFNFDTAGYQAPADWARVRDLIPDDIEPKTLARWQKGGQKKSDAISLLNDLGIDVPRFDPITVGRRNQ